MRFAILSLGLLVAAGTARADEEKVALKEVPEAVLSAVKEKFPEGKVKSAAKETEDGKTVYEIVVKDDEETIDVSVNAKGKVLESETTISAKKLPKAVTAAIEEKYPEAKITKAEKVTKYGKEKEKTSYEVVMASEGKEAFEVKLSSKGKILVDETGEKTKPKSVKSKKDKADDDDDDDDDNDDDTI